MLIKLVLPLALIVQMLIFANNISEVSNRIKLESRKLNSGKYQIKFFVLNDSEKDRYGYMLVEPSVTLKEVVHKINHSLTRKDDFGYLKLMKSNLSKEIILF